MYRIENNAELLSVCCSMEQLAYIRPVTFTGGDAQGLDGLLVKNGQLSFVVLPGRCLDIAELSYKGVNLSFAAKGGMQGSGANGNMGLMFTSGLENVCPPCDVDGIHFPPHGTMRFHRASQLGYTAAWESNRYVLRIKGQMRQSNVFGENLVLSRTITTILGENKITVSDVVENLGFTSQPVLILYHCNAGYPLLDVGARVLAPTTNVKPRDAEAEKGIDHWNIYRAPQPKKPEQCFTHTLVADTDGQNFMAIVNDQLELGLKVSSSADTLPNFIQWKTEASGDYALGLEPTNGTLAGRAAEGSIHELGAMQQENFSVSFSIIDGKAEIDAIDSLCEERKKAAYQ